MIGTDENRAVLHVEVIFWGGKRKAPPSLVSGKYRPHFVVTGTNELEMSRNVQSGNTQNLKSSVAPVRLPAAPASTPGTSQAVAQAGCVYRP